MSDSLYTKYLSNLRAHLRTTIAIMRIVAFTLRRDQSNTFSVAIRCTFSRVETQHCGHSSRGA